MSKNFFCEVCNKKVEKLSMRDSDGKWVCESDIPAKEKAQLAKAKGQL